MKSTFCDSIGKQREENLKYDGRDWNKVAEENGYRKKDRKVSFQTIVYSLPSSR